MTMRFLILLFLWSLFFAPLPPGYAINPQTNECGSLGPEDEYGEYLLLSPWEKHYDQVIQNGSANCQIGQDNTVETCCKKVGYTYVPGDIGKQCGIMLLTPIAFIVWFFKVLPFLLIGLVIYWLIKMSNKRDDQNNAT